MRANQRHCRLKLIVTVASLSPQATANGNYNIIEVAELARVQGDEDQRS
jgi:hypothetical protein